LKIINYEASKHNLYGGKELPKSPDIHKYSVFGSKRKNMMLKYSISSLLVALLIALAFVNTSSAQPFVNYSIPVFISIWASCLNHGQGDVINLSGNLHFLFDDSDGVHQKFQTNHQGITGVSQTTGQKYVATGVNEVTYASKLGGTFTNTFEDSFHLIGQGTSTSLLVHSSLHVTVNANGVQSAFVDNFSIECK
jgi:hypothetical protein